jgi:hypothetical protein
MKPTLTFYPIVTTRKNKQSCSASSFQTFVFVFVFLYFVAKKGKKERVFFFILQSVIQCRTKCAVKQLRKKWRGNNQNIQTQTHWQAGWSLNDHFLLAVVRILLQTRLLLSIVTTPNTNFQTKMKK